MRLPSTVLHLLALVVSLRTSPALATPPQPPLLVGMYPHEVVDRWGSPTDKSELEGLREDVWYYLNGAHVRFKEGRVSEYRLRGDKSGRSEEEDSSATPRASYRRIMQGIVPLEPKEIRELFKEVMRGAEGEGGVATSPTNAQPLPPPVPAPVLSETVMNDTMPFIE